MIWFLFPAEPLNLEMIEHNSNGGVEISSFLLAKFPVTQELYQEIMNENPSHFEGDRLPVETVSWKDAVILCNSLSKKMGFECCYNVDLDSAEITSNPKASGFRLPTEAEWEYACKADIHRDKIW